MSGFGYSDWSYDQFEKNGHFSTGPPKNGTNHEKMGAKLKVLKFILVLL